MVKKLSKTSEVLADSIVRGMQEVKGQEILSIDLRKLPNAICDFFVVCHGTSDTQVEALARSVEKTVFRELSEHPGHKEGTENAEWVLLDYFNVVVHIFNLETRVFYGLEKLWADADVKEIECQL